MESNKSNSSYTISGNTVKYYGFYFPPVGIIGVLDLILVPWDASFYIVDPLLVKELPYEEIGQQQNPYVIISTQEGASHHWFDRLIPKLVEHGVALDHIILRSACLWDPDSPVKRVHTIVDECSDFCSSLGKPEPNIKSPSHHFVCLNRLHRWQRYRLITTMLDLELNKFGAMSYIELPMQADPRLVSLQKPDVSWKEQRNISDPEISGALFNVISEAAYEPEPNTHKLVHHNLPGMTEKSYKCFALFQIPIWLAPYRAVECYRKLGFDVFDDIVDHSYDLEPDPEKRIGMVAEQVQKICHFHHAELNDLKQKLLSRFANNFKVLESWAYNFNNELPQWQALFSRNNSN